MATFFIVVIMVVAVLLILVVLAQDPKSGGLTSGMSGASSLMGARRATDWIEKATWILAVTLFVLSLGVNLFISSDNTTESGVPNSTIIENANDAEAPVLEDVPTSEEAPAEDGQ